MGNVQIILVVPAGQEFRSDQAPIGKVGDVTVWASPGQTVRIVVENPKEKDRK